jgi:hypothetical protein
MNFDWDIFSIRDRSVGTGSAAFAADAVMPTGHRRWSFRMCGGCMDILKSAPGFPEQSLPELRHHQRPRQSRQVLRVQRHKAGRVLDSHVATGSSNGLYQADVWARNVGYRDQQYIADLSKAGEQYLTFGWDQTPHLYSTSALTLYNGVGSNALTLPSGLSNQLFVASGNTNPITTPNAAKVKAIIDGNVHQTDIGIKRDTGAVEYRYTPTDNWDFRADYANMHRSGTQVEGVVFSPGTSGSRADAPKPIDDTTQNFGASGEYIGTSPWNQKFNLAAYGGLDL